MPAYTYLAREAGTGREIRSSLEAASEQAAIAALLNRNLLVVSIQEKMGRKGKTAGGNVPLADLVVFTRQLATMIDAGLAMVQSLQALAEQTTNKVMRDVIMAMCPEPRAETVFDSADQTPQGVQPLFVCMVDAGRKAACWRRFWPVWQPISRIPPAAEKVKSAMMYPTP